MLITARFAEGAALDSVVNVAAVQWSDPDDPFVVFSADDDATFGVVLSGAELLALTGVTSWSGLWWAAGFVAVGALMVSRRAREE